MTRSRRHRLGWPRLAALVILAAGVAASGAQTPSVEPAPAAGSLRAEMALERTLFQPSQSIPVRFTLFNATDETVELPLTCMPAEADAITLPRELIIGTREQPRLFIAFENERAAAVRLTSPEGEHGHAGVLRLAPRAAIGAEFDLATVHRLVRYSGHYRLEWQPLGETVAPIVRTFRVEPRKDAVLVTDYGKITFSMAYDEAPLNVENFLGLVRDRFYDGKSIHRVVPGFIIQGGSPDGNRTGVRPDGKLVPAEFRDVPFVAGTLAMARKPNDPDSASCQFFVSLARLEELDGNYTVIGQASDEESLRTLQLIEQLPTDEEDRPLRPVAIRFFTLVDVFQEGTSRRLDSVGSP